MFFRVYADAAGYNNGQRNKSKPSFGTFASLITMNGFQIGEPMLGGSEGSTVNSNELLGL